MTSRMYLSLQDRMSDAHSVAALDELRAEIERDYAGDARIEDLRHLLAMHESALEALPQPRTEWVALERVLGAELLATLVGVSASSLRRYAAGTRPTSDTVAARLHFLGHVVGDLAGSYNDIGVRRWFGRARTQLDGQAPAALLQDAWHPQDEGPARVRRLAVSLLSARAT